jgi:AcrR family transcriptional regulator
MVESRADARANRVRVLEAAQAVFAQKGLGAEMKEIAEQAGVGVGTIYRHFPSKADLLAALAIEAQHDVLTGVDLAELTPDPIEALSIVLTRAFETVEAHGWLIEALMSGELAPERRAEMHGEMRHQEFSARLQAIVQRGVDQGRFRADLDIGVATTMLLGMMVPWSYHCLRAGRTPRETAEAVLKLFRHGAEQRARGA